MSTTRYLHRMEELFFEILFVMTEVVGGPNETLPFQKTLFLFYVDLGQVLRVMTTPAYGWSKTTYDLVKKMDLVYLVADLISHVVPRYSLFILASFLVLLALADTFYAVKLLGASAKVQTMWPIKLLRFLVASIVTVLFSSVLKWLIIPIECEVSDEVSFSQYLHGDGSPCTPWRFPEAIFSTYTLMASLAYIAFAIIVSLLSFETNPLARGVRASSTGRVEAMWIVAKVAVTFLAYAANFLKSVTCAVLLLLLMLAVLYQHLTLLPFHRHEINLLRGGVFSFTVWYAFATVLVSSSELSQTQEWTLLALSPVVFVLGACFTHWIRVGIDRNIERLRAEFLHHAGSSDKGTVSGDMRSPKRRAELVESPPMKGRQGDVTNARKDAEFEHFYDPTWESRKAFSSTQRAQVVIRTLLYRREKDDMPFLLHLMDRAIEEYPGAVPLRIYELLLVRFVKRNQLEATALEKRYKSDKKKLPIDYRYVLFALERKAIKESAGQSLGKGNFSVINVMEFDAGLERAKKAHMQCITCLKKLWAATKSIHKPDRQQHCTETMINQVKNLNSTITAASQEYKMLVQMYPTSVTLLISYAHFVESILNDANEAEALRFKAEALEEFSDNGSVSLHDGEEEEEQQMAGQGREGRAKSEGTGSSANSSTVKGIMQKKLVSLRDSLLKDECGRMVRVHRAAMVGLLLMVVFATVGYVLMNHFLLSDMAVANINFIDSALLFSVHSVMSLFLLRDAEIAARFFDSSRTAHDKALVDAFMVDMKETHKTNFEHLPSTPVANFYKFTDFHVFEPAVRGWVERSYNFWDLINDWARRVLRAVRTPAEDLRDDNFRLDQISDEKRNLVYVYENTYEVVMPAYEELLHLYQDEVVQFAKLAQTLVIVTALVNSLTIFAVSVGIMIAIHRLVPKVSCSLVSIELALRLPRHIQVKIREYYVQLEDQMLEMDDEERQRQALEKAHDPSSGIDSPLHSAARPAPKHLGEAQMGGSGHMRMNGMPPFEVPMDQFTPLPNLVDTAGAGSSQPSEEGAGVVPVLPERNASPTADDAVRNWLQSGSPTAAARPSEPRLSLAGNRSPPPPKPPTSDEDDEDDQDEDEDGVVKEKNAEEGGLSAVEEDKKGHSAVVFVHRPGHEEGEEIQPVEGGEGSVGGLSGGNDAADDDGGSSAPADEGQDESEAGADDKTATKAELEMDETVMESRPAEEMRAKLAVVVPTVAGKEESSHGTKSALKSRPRKISFCENTEGGNLDNKATFVLEDHDANIRALRQAADTAAQNEHEEHNGNGERQNRDGFTRRTPSHEDGSVKMSEVDDNVLLILNAETLKRRPWHSRISTWSVVTAFMVAFSLFGIIYPMRALPDIKDMAPLVDHSGRRAYMVQSCIFLARELILDDGFSRMTKPHIAQLLQETLDNLKREHHAVRLGGDLGISKGADFRFHSHNEVMYEPGCAWRTDDAAASSSGGHRRAGPASTLHGDRPSWSGVKNAPRPAGSGGRRATAGEWNYDRCDAANGPAHWPADDGAFCAGEEQSPIDVCGAEPFPADKNTDLAFAYPAGSVEMILQTEGQAHISVRGAETPTLNAHDIPRVVGRQGAASNATRSEGGGAQHRRGSVSRRAVAGEWNYDRCDADHGPSQWGAVDGALCDGGEQSPIDVCGAADVPQGHDTDLSFAYPSDPIGMKLKTEGQAHVSVSGSERLTLNAHDIPRLVGRQQAASQRRRSGRRAVAGGWNYDRCDIVNGPAHWPADDGAFCAGEEQSPIDVCGAEPFPADKRTALNFTYPAGPIPMKLNSGGQAHISVTGSETLDLNAYDIPRVVGRQEENGIDITWQLAQAHFHWGRDASEGSEHFLEGRQYPLEMHFVHFNAKHADLTAALASGESDALLVVGQLFKVDDTAAMRPALEALAAGLGQTTAARNEFNVSLDPTELMDSSGGYYAYAGSLTTPTCNPVVTWVVMAEVLTITTSALDNFHDKTVDDDGHSKEHGNFRPLQPRGGRTVYMTPGVDTFACAPTPAEPAFSCEEADITWQLAQAHFHWGRDASEGSEHFLEGRQYPLEMHFVHFNAKHADLTAALASGESDALLVVGQLFKVDDTAAMRPALEAIAAGLGQRDLDSSSASASELDISLNPAELMDSSGGYYMYPGSLTTPTCNPVVTWVVMAEVLTITTSALDNFHDKTVDDDGHSKEHGNFRPLQPRGGRTVYMTPGVATSPCEGTLAQPVFSCEEADITWQLAQAHFHWGRDASEGSEHFLEGRQYPLEMHFVHFNAKHADLTAALASGESDALLVVGQLFKVDDTAAMRPALEALAAGLGQVSGAGGDHNDEADGEGHRRRSSEAASVFNVSLDPTELMDSSGGYYAYAGSLTTPTCTPVVTWVVMAEMLPVSSEVLALFRLNTANSEGHVREHGNFRPLQPRGGRTVYMTESVKTQACEAHASEPLFTCTDPEGVGVLEMCRMEGRVEAAGNGLHHLMLTFFDATQAVIDKFAPDGFHDYDASSRDRDAAEFLMLHPMQEHLDEVEEDEDMQFMLANLEGDLFVALNYVQDLFHDEVHHMLDKAHIENEALFVMYVLTLITLWYVVLFKSVVFGVYSEVAKAKDFVSRMPLQVMSTKEITAITAAFQQGAPDDDHHDEPRNGDDNATVASSQALQ